MSKKLFTIISLLMLASLVLSACGPKVKEGTVASGDVVTGYFNTSTDIPTLDPQLAEDEVSINYIKNLFIHLTSFDLVTTDVIPEGATSWDISDDGLTYTFTIRTDIPWVKHNPATGEVKQEVDADGNPRFLVASDYVYGIKRACDPNLASYYSSVIAPFIVGCADYLNYEDPENIPAEMYDAIGVTAPADDTLVIQLAEPAGFFLSMTTMWTLTPTPQWAIEEYGDQWTEVGNIVTNGRFVLNEWTHGVSRTILRNPLLPKDMQGDGNMEKMVVNVVPDTATDYALWLNNEVDEAGIPSEELETQFAEYPDETVQVPRLTVYYIAFRTTKAPFDDARVRAAFSAAFDRQAFVDVVRQGNGIIMNHFAPPGMFGAPPIDEVGVGFDPEYAREELAAAGYPNCEGFPQVSLLGYSGETTLAWIEFAQAQWEENLGCSADLIQIEQQDFSDLLVTTEAPDAEAPHMWTLGWGPDYPDENNWVGDVLYCTTNTRIKRACSDVDDEIIAARKETDPNKRIEMYAEIESKFFDKGGEFPLMPLWFNIQYYARHSWLDYTWAVLGGQQYYNFHIDAEAQAAARQ
jgi:oligopeptide transport system substrate-binding protein